MHKRSLLQAAVLAAMVAHVPGALAQSEIRIAHVYSKTGPLEAYGKQTQAGLLMGFASMSVAEIEQAVQVFATCMRERGLA